MRLGERNTNERKLPMVLNTKAIRLHRRNLSFKKCIIQISPHMNPDNDLQAVVAGHICLDITPGLRHINASNMQSLIAPGKLTSVTKPEICTGGVVPNTGLAMHILGCNVSLMGKVGNDHFGLILKDILTDYNCEEGLIIDPESSTSYTIILAPQGLDRAFLNYPGANETFCSNDINYEVVSKARLFHFGYPPLLERIFANDGDELVTIFSKVKSSGPTTSMDMAPSDPSSNAGKVNWRKVLQRSLPYVDIFMPSLEELFFMLNKDEYLEVLEKEPCCDFMAYLGMERLKGLANELLGMGTKVVMIKCGVYGCYLRTASYEQLVQGGKALLPLASEWADFEFFHPSFKIELASATGAGDTCIAGFLVSLLSQGSIDHALRNACACGALAVSVVNSLSSLKPIEEIEKQFEAGWKLNNMEIINSKNV
jgi:sugar/nucleoside kinase (ribokinase family)